MSGSASIPRRSRLAALAVGTLLVTGCAGSDDEPPWGPDGTLLMDIKPVDRGRLSAGFGWRERHPILGRPAFHAGIDWAAPLGTPVRAAADGHVVVRRPDYGGYGNYLKIDHAVGIETVYAHLFRMDVRPGRRVRRGQIIGWVGRTGRATAPHLHFELHVAGQPVDPLRAASYALSPPIRLPSTEPDDPWRSYR